MMRSLFAGVSGMRNHQVRMDVIGNNVANVNTVGYKASRVTFEEAFSQLVHGASRPPGGDSAVSGGTNPIQVGLGMNISSIDLLFTQGNLESTGIATDLAIQGNSFFVVSDGMQRFYTRAGNFQLDADGRLVSGSNGFGVQGRLAEHGVLTDQVGDIRLPFGQKSAAKATSEATVGGNLNAAAAIGAQRQAQTSVYDAQGARHELVVLFEKTGANQWSYSVEISGGTLASGATGTLSFNEDGSLAGDGTLAADLMFTPEGFTGTQPISLNFGRAGSIDGISQFASPSTLVVRDQDGYTMGDLQQIGVDMTGTITGSFTNGVRLTLGQVVLADFNNPTGLMRMGDNMYTPSANSGAAVLGFAGEGSQSMVTSGALEMSNVDLAQEFTSMIVAQRGFQSNARVITAADEMLQELVNLKR